ncbi:polysaccharide biosynthesis/export family protein [Akkermansiaceae bacterium]|nr:polysaccharide biosynthesis/export family protein [Akkermansiaceae bacterium]MDB4537758.1 polysaccharide biosynthesis/export family protein [Akkermansiaceae bacterium]
MKIITSIILLFLSVALSSGQGIQANQTLEIKVLGVPPSEQARLNSSYQVSSSGTVTLWEIGVIKASGRTPNQLAAAIAAAYKEKGIYTSPNFQVTTPTDGALVQKRFTVGGQVKAPGPKPYTNGLTLYTAIQTAGGKTPFGATNRVKLFRNGKVYTYNLMDDRYKNIKIYPGDAIEVPQTDWKGQ